MALFETCHEEIAANDGIKLLVSYLNEKSKHIAIKTNLVDTNDMCFIEKSAFERVQQKASIAIGRLAKNPGNALILIDLGGTVFELL
jgi:hypothetical protein